MIVKDSAGFNSVSTAPQVYGNGQRRGKRLCMNWKATLPLAAILFALLMAGLSTRAHGYIVRAIPADRSAHERPPTRLQYWFSEDLEPRFSQIKLRDQAGTVVAIGAVDPDNHALLGLRVPPGLGDGAYVVELRPAFASDGHVIAESRVFFVGEAFAGVDGGLTDAGAIPLEALWRALLNLANFLLFGASLLYSAVLLPAWGGSGPAGARLPERVMRRLRICLVASILLALAANLIALAQQSMAFFNTDFVQVMQQNLWQVTLIGSRFGDIWILRLVLLIFCAALLFTAEYFRALMPGLAVGIWRGLPWLGALFIGLSMITGHAAGSTLLPWVAIAVDWLHALTVAFWLGGALTLTLLLPVALAPYDGERKQAALRAVLLRFSSIMLPLVALIIVSGAYNALNFVNAPADLNTSYGRTLGIKLLLALPVFVLGGWQHIALRPSLVARIRSILARLPAPVPSSPLLRLEVVFMLATLAAVAWLSATPIPEPALPRSEIETPRATLNIGDFVISTAILPGGPGVNTYDTVITRDSQPATDLQVRLQLVNPQRDRRSPWQAAEEAEAGLYVNAGDEIDQAGLWWTLIDLVGADGQKTRAALAWDISEAAAVQQLRAPGIVHILTLMVLAALLFFVAWPRLRRLIVALEVSPASLILAVLALAVAVGVMVAGALLINERQREYELTLNPPPRVVNTVLPDAASLRRGEALYREHCLHWQGQSADFRALRNRLASARDDFLYAAVSAGWRGLEACAGGLDVTARWDLVNYFRTFEEWG